MSIPESSDFVQGDTITVQLGDTLYGLAKQHLGDGARWKELADYNGIANPSRLQVGAVLVVPR